MATEVKAGGYRELGHLKDARRATFAATSKAETVMREVARLREGLGRPDYGYLNSVLGDLCLQLSKNSKALDEMWNMRAAMGHVAADDLSERVSALEAQISMLEQRIGQVMQ